MPGREDKRVSSVNLLGALAPIDSEGLFGFQFKN
jgi:hypothetical protein